MRSIVAAAEEREWYTLWSGWRGLLGGHYEQRRAVTRDRRWAVVASVSTRLEPAISTQYNVVCVELRCEPVGLG